MSCLLFEKLPLFVLAIAFSFITFYAQKRAEAVRSLSLIPVLLRLANAVDSVAAYLRQTFWPTNLCVEYAYPHAGIPPSRLAIALLLLVGITALAVARLDRLEPGAHGVVDDVVRAHRREHRHETLDQVGKGVREPHAESASAGDVQLALPYILLAIAVLAVVGSGIVNIILVLSLAQWVTYARVVRSSVLAEREKDYVKAAQALGLNRGAIMRRHVLPNVFAPVIVIATFSVAQTIIAESALSFLGLGLPASTPTPTAPASITSPSPRTSTPHSPPSTPSTTHPTAQSPPIGPAPTTNSPSKHHQIPPQKSPSPAAKPSISTAEPTPTQSNNHPRNCRQRALSTERALC